MQERCQFTSADDEFECAMCCGEHKQELTAASCAALEMKEYHLAITVNREL